MTDKAEARCFHLAMCFDCEVEMPFFDQAERDSWAEAHCSSTGHDITYVTKWRRINL